MEPDKREGSEISEPEKLDMGGGETLLTESQVARVLSELADATEMVLPSELIKVPSFVM